MHDSLADRIATCDLPRGNRSCALLNAIQTHPSYRLPGRHRCA